MNSGLILLRKKFNGLKKFKSICTGDAPFYEWFKEGKLNISENCLDRHRNKNKQAIIHIAENNQKKIISYDELYAISK